MVQASLFHSFTKVYHKAPYAQVSPSRPELSAAGKTVILTGGHQGIGRAIADSFAQAQASNVILLARRSGVLAKARVDLQAQYSNTTFHTYTVAIDDTDAVADVFTRIRADVGEPDVAVLCAAYIAKAASDIAGEVAEISKSMDTNVKGNINLIREFVGPASGWKKQGEPGHRPKTVIELNSAAAHIPTPQNAAAYNGSKAAIARMLAIAQREVDLGSSKWPDKLRLFSMHPGGVLTEAAWAVGAREGDFPWDDVYLPGNFAVWLASSEADFLRGRYLWANWDVNELIARKQKIIEGGLLQIGLYGEALHPVDVGAGMHGKFSETAMVEEAGTST